ncbi:hypothetical protein Q4Q39_12220 [Flavivirga amylovorans]|uniref:Thioredoxin family protein n=1 Tax=Flavivirga amylovorans TaxID=870486 RepID=A0ABT8X2J1_9FLAO|nr:hypothetical protein [Flavivirga amylovorans]MDO5988171.1 hypothetical protein [Flavivirga amylovorans]
MTNYNDLTIFDEDPDGKENYGNVAKAYKVSFLPTTFLIDINDYYRMSTT